jgi:hypothetical protein
MTVAGLVDVLSGELTLRRHLAFNAFLADISGEFNISLGATLVCDRGTHQFGATSALYGDGGFRSTGGNTAIINGSYELTGPLILNNNGNIIFNTGASIIPATLSINSGSISTADPLRITNSFAGESATISGAGSVTVDAGATVAVAVGCTLACAFFENNGVFRNHGTTLNFGGNLRFTNRPGAIFRMTTNSTAISPWVRLPPGASPLLVNEGELRSDTTGTATISVPLQQDGSLFVLAGTLSLDASGIHSGLAEISNGAILRLTGLNTPTSVFHPGSIVRGAGEMMVRQTVDFRGSYEVAGLLKVETGTLSFNTGLPVTVPHMENSFSVVDGNDPLTITTTLYWHNGGTFGGPAPLYFPETLETTMDSGANLFRPCQGNAGVMTWTDARIVLGNNIVFTNLPTGSILINGTAGLRVKRGANAVGQAIYNQGAIRINTTDAAELDVPFFHSGNFRVESGEFWMAFDADWIQTAGVTELAGGNLRFFGGSAWQLHGGTVTGSGTVFDEDVSNYGATISPGTSPGEIIFEESVSLTPNGALHIELAGTTPGSGYDRLTANDAVSLTGGRLHVTLANGFVPAAGDKFMIVSAGTRIGTFSTFTYPSNQIAFKLNYLPNGVEVEAVGFEPRIDGVEISGTNIVITGTGGSPNGTYSVLTSTNVALWLTNWTPVLTNLFNSVGNFSFTNPVSSQEPQRFYLLQSP